MLIILWNIFQVIMLVGMIFVVIVETFKLINAIKELIKSWRK